VPTRTGELTARRWVSLYCCCSCFSKDLVQIQLTFQTALANSGSRRVQASGGFCYPGPNRTDLFLNGPLCTKVNSSLPCFGTLKILIKFGRILAVGSHALYQRISTLTLSLGHWLSVLWNLVLSVSHERQSRTRHVNLHAGFGCPVDLGTGIWGPSCGLSISS
jgi:hypothetical protein